MTAASYPRPAFSERGLRYVAFMGKWGNGAPADACAAAAPDLIRDTFDEWVEASRLLDSALQDWLEARRANEEAATRYRAAVANYRLDDPVAAHDPLASVADETLAVA